MNELTLDRQNPADFSHEDGTPEDGTLIDLGGLWSVLWQRRTRIAQVSIVCFAAAILIAILLPARYTSSASFIPPGSGSAAGSGAAALAGQLAGLGMGDVLGGSSRQGDLYTGILKSRAIAAEIIQRFHLMEVYKASKESQAEKALESNIDVTVDPKSGIVTLEVTDRSPSRAQAMADALLAALREKNGTLALTESSQRRLFFEQQLAKEKDALEDAEVTLTKTQEQSGLIAPSGQTESEIRAIADLQAQVASREVELAALREGATEQNPDLIRLQSEVADLKGQLARLQTGASKVDGAIPTSKVPQLELDFVRAEREVKYHETLFDALARQYEAARLDESREAPVLQVLDPASYPDTSSSPHRTLIALGGLVLGLILGCAWVLGKASIANSRRRSQSEAAA